MTGCCFSVFAYEIKHAAFPVRWTRLEADQRAREQNSAT